MRSGLHATRPGHETRRREPWSRRRLVDLSPQEINQRLAEQVVALCDRLLPNGVRHGHEWSVGSVAGERGDSLKVHLIGAKAGCWADFATGQRGRCIDLVMACQDLEFPAAMGWAAEFLRLDSAQSASRGTIEESAVQRADRAAREAAKARASAEIAEKFRGWARDLWDGALPIAGTPADDYLRGRGIACPLPATLRYHPRCPCREAGHRLPALIAAVQSVQGKFLGVHRIWLEPGLDRAWIKARLREPKMSLGPINGGAVRLSRGGPAVDGPARFGPAPFGVGEGIETMLAVLSALGEAKLRIWAALSAPGLIAVELPADATAPVFWGDHDNRVEKPGPMQGKRPGLEAATARAARAARDGRRPSLAMPDAWAWAAWPALRAGDPAADKFDWLDALNLAGPDAISWAARHARAPEDLGSGGPLAQAQLAPSLPREPAPLATSGGEASLRREP